MPRDEPISLELWGTVFGTRSNKRRMACRCERRILAHSLHGPQGSRCRIKLYALAQETTMTGHLIALLPTELLLRFRCCQSARNGAAGCAVLHVECYLFSENVGTRSGHDGCSVDGKLPLQTVWQTLDARDSRRSVRKANMDNISHITIKMSSLSRRACYKCGNVGHYAEVCSSAERLCYNCKLCVSPMARSFKPLTKKYR
ncbi:uncharacterized protein LY79DRAFT_340634 [Colletotrichum navitas]|uniref:CCHC-type domain-containing protein n=1 Tax=Colletotrichum navitas TaxID=681940 RepID=A0AAD8PSP2_9PEZI|nr:uncharacterized protein LY79DRAFT_340634 [Colletotrichum navitas]KAK1579522.1 hypothetical protein LY79DRAFT_340634 [Colletotrichum navitas]